MNGTGLIYRPGQDEPEVVHFTKPVLLGYLQAAVGGSIQWIPHFERIFYGGVIRPCVAYCNDEGKLDGLPPNTAATVLWEHAAPGELQDFLAGPVIVLIGDNAFMRSL